MNNQNQGVYDATGMHGTTDTTGMHSGTGTTGMGATGVTGMHSGGTGPTGMHHSGTAGSTQYDTTGTNQDKGVMQKTKEGLIHAKDKTVEGMQHAKDKTMEGMQHTKDKVTGKSSKQAYHDKPVHHKKVHDNMPDSAQEAGAKTGQKLDETWDAGKHKVHEMNQ